VSCASTRATAGDNADPARPAPAPRITSRLFRRTPPFFPWPALDCSFMDSALSLDRSPYVTDSPPNSLLYVRERFPVVRTVLAGGPYSIVRKPCQKNQIANPTMITPLAPVT